MVHPEREDGGTVAVKEIGDLTGRKSGRAREGNAREWDGTRRGGQERERERREDHGMPEVHGLWSEREKKRDVRGTVRNQRGNSRRGRKSASPSGSSVRHGAVSRMHVDLPPRVAASLPRDSAPAIATQATRTRSFTGTTACRLRNTWMHPRSIDSRCETVR